MYVFTLESLNGNKQNAQASKFTGTTIKGSIAQILTQNKTPKYRGQGKYEEKIIFHFISDFSDNISCTSGPSGG